MADPNEFDDVMPENTARTSDGGPLKENMLPRLLHMILIALMLSMAQTVLGVLTILQFVITLVNGKVPNARLADLGTDLGIWMAKAVRYQTAASEVKPWPWTDLD